MKTREEQIKQIAGEVCFIGPLQYSGFIQGANWADANPAWHDLRKDPEDLPEEDKVVLVVHAVKGWPYMAFYKSGMWYRYNKGELPYTRVYDIKAWLPLPEFNPED